MLKFYTRVSACVLSSATAVNQSATQITSSAGHLHQLLPHLTSSATNLTQSAELINKPAIRARASIGLFGAALLVIAGN